MEDGHDGDSSASSSESSLEDSEEGVVADSSGVRKKNTIRFTSAQRSCLNRYWSKGLTGCGKKFSSLIIRAAKDAGLTCDQMKVIAVYF